MPDGRHHGRARRLARFGRRVPQPQHLLFDAGRVDPCHRQAILARAVFHEAIRDADVVHERLDAAASQALGHGAARTTGDDVLLERDDRATRIGNLSRLSLSTRGGGDRYQFYVAGDRDTEQGFYYTSDNNRTSIRSP